MCNLSIKKINFFLGFTYSVRKLAETGFLSYHKAYWQRKKLECVESNVKLEAIGLRQFSPAIHVLVFGFIIGMVMLFIEIIYFWKTQRNAAREYLIK